MVEARAKYHLRPTVNMKDARIPLARLVAHRLHHEAVDIHAVRVGKGKPLRRGNGHALQCSSVEIRQLLQLAAIPKVHLRKLQTHSCGKEEPLSVLSIEINEVVVAAEERLYTGFPRPYTQAGAHAVRVEEIQRLAHHSLSRDGAGEAVGDHLGVDPAVIAAQIFLAIFVHHKECGVLVHAIVPHDQSQAERLPA